MKDMIKANRCGVAAFVSTMLNLIHELISTPDGWSHGAATVILSAATFIAICGLEIGRNNANNNANNHA